MVWWKGTGGVGRSNGMFLFFISSIKENLSVFNTRIELNTHMRVKQSHKATRSSTLHTNKTFELKNSPSENALHL